MACKQRQNHKRTYLKELRSNQKIQVAYIIKSLPCGNVEIQIAVSVIPTKTEGQSMVIHHSEFSTLRPHQWLVGEVIEGLFHIAANQLDVRNIYIMNHYTAGVILSREEERISRHGLSKINFDNYQCIVSFVNTSNVHWKFLFINALHHTVYVVNPSKSSKEKAESSCAAKNFSKYLKLRRQCYGKTEWQNIKWKGGVLTHPTQQDSSSCGVIVTMIAREVMKAFPAVPVISFGTSKREMAIERGVMGAQILESSVFDEANNCAMCSMAKPIGFGPPTTHWIQCDCCDRWFHEECLGLKKKELKRARTNSWNCKLCSFECL